MFFNIWSGTRYWQITIVITPLKDITPPNASTPLQTIVPLYIGVLLQAIATLRFCRRAQAITPLQAIAPLNVIAPLQTIAPLYSPTPSNRPTQRNSPTPNNQPTLWSLSKPSPTRALQKHRFIAIHSTPKWVTLKEGGICEKKASKGGGGRHRGTVHGSFRGIVEEKS